jgi:NADH dehydrogenase
MTTWRTSRQPRVVVIGAGFAGLWASRALARRLVDVLVIDRVNYHTFLPLLYQVAAAELEPEDIAFPIRSILRDKPNLRFALGEVGQIDMASRRVVCGERSFIYDYLIVAAGSASHFFGIPGGEAFAFRLKTLDEAVLLRNHILGCFEEAARQEDPGVRIRALTFTIIGGGPTGVEFAGALAELIDGPLLRDFPEVEREAVRIVLVDATDRLLPALPRAGSEFALRRLEQMGVEVRLNAAVSAIGASDVSLRDGAVLPTDTVVWTAGVRGAPLVKSGPWPVGKLGLVDVLPSLQVAEHPEVYVVGDLCHFEQDGRQLPKVAPVAIQQGTAAARNVLRQVDGLAPLPFCYHDRGTMVTIGRNAAVAVLGGRCFTGYPAWLIWLSVHIANLIGFRNRLLVLINWAVDYLFSERAIRLILPSGTSARAPEGQAAGAEASRPD